MKRKFSASMLVVFLLMCAILVGVTALGVHSIIRNSQRAVERAAQEANINQTNAANGTADISGENGTNDPAAEETPPPVPDPTPPPSPTPTPPPAIAVLPAPDYDTTAYDTVILNARLINPETNSDLEGYNIGILNGRIAAVTRRPLRGTRVIDATGLIAAPGFIDILSFQITETGARFKIADGVTSNMQMHGGAINARNDLGRFINNPPIINFGMSNFISGIRSNMGYGPHAVMTSQASIDRLVETARNNILNGSIGVSVIPEYTPGVQGAELLALAYLAAEMDVPMHWHVRYATPHGDHNSLVAIQEVIDLARRTGAAMHINHINSTGATHVAVEAFAMVDAARAEGLVITACVYPYDFWATHLNSARFAPNWQTRFNLTYGDLQIANTETRLTAASFRQLRATNTLVLARGALPEHELRLAFEQPFMMIGSDTMVQAHMNNHPRGSGTFSRMIGHYVRDEGVLTLMDSLTMMTIRPAQHLERASYDAERKGRLQIGADADIVLFCFETIRDTATPENVASFSEGVQYVLVNGKIGVYRAEIQNARAGTPIRSRFVSPREVVPYVMNELTRNGESMGEVASFELFGLPFVDLRETAEILSAELYKTQDGVITFNEARLNMGETAFENYGQQSHLRHEPVIFRGSVFVPISDLPNLFYNVTYAPLV